MNQGSQNEQACPARNDNWAELLRQQQQHAACGRASGERRLAVV